VSRWVSRNPREDGANIEPTLTQQRTEHGEHGIGPSHG
jgi:hypothetical protein